MQFIWDVHVHQTNLPFYHDMIIGKYPLDAFHMDIRFSDQTLSWEDGVIPMKPADATVRQSLFIKDDLEEDLGRILDAKYEKADLPKIVSDYDHISNNQKQQLLRLLQKYETLFDGTLGTWKGSTYDIELKDNVKPYHASAYNMPKSIDKTMKLEVD